MFNYCDKDMDFCFLFFLFFDKQGYLDLFEYQTIPLGMCNLPISHTLDYYRKESHGGGLKMLARGFEPRIS